MSGAILLGTQGWNYAAWIGPFYPGHIRPAEHLKVYARAFPTVEVDSTFYAVPPEQTVRGWAAKVPDHFRFAVKLPQEITHVRRLVDAGVVVDEFADRMRLLGPKLGAVLIQLGPDFGPENRPVLERFLPRLPADIRFAVEFRRRGWLMRPVLELLREHRVALTLVEGRWLRREKVLRLAEQPTADFAYLRFLGPDRTIDDYSRLRVDRGAVLSEWAPRIAELAARVGAVYGYVNNHFEGHSPASVRRLQTLLGQAPVEPGQLAEQTELF